MQKEKNIQIPLALFSDIVKYFLLDERNEELKLSIRNGLIDKLEKSTRHEIYTKYKTAPTDEEKEKARQEYLERVGIPKSFRW